MATRSGKEALVTAYEIRVIGSLARRRVTRSPT